MAASLGDAMASLSCVMITIIKWLFLAFLKWISLFSTIKTHKWVYSFKLMHDWLYYSPLLRSTLPAFEFFVFPGHPASSNTLPLVAFLLQRNVWHGKQLKYTVITLFFEWYFKKIIRKYFSPCKCMFFVEQRGIFIVYIREFLQPFASLPFNCLVTCGLLSAIGDEMMIVFQFISYFSTSWKSILYIESKGMVSYISFNLFCSAHMVFSPGNIFHIWILLMTFFGLTTII